MRQKGDKETQRRRQTTRGVDTRTQSPGTNCMQHDQQRKGDKQRRTMALPSRTEKPFFVTSCSFPFFFVFCLGRVLLLLDSPLSLSLPPDLAFFFFFLSFFCDLALVR